MPVLSIVVPVYNAEAYLAACIDSLLAQNMETPEIILVNDGSRDQSGAICDAYAGKHPTIRVIHKENEGQTATRKAGLRLATGKYVAFVDSDDWVEPTTFPPMVALAEQHDADLVATGFIRDFGDRCENGANACPTGIYTGEKLQWLRENAVFYVPEMAEGIVPALWAKIFRRETLAAGILSRNDTIRFGEDALCTNSALALARCVVVDNACTGYHYRIWGGSISHAYYPNYTRDLNILYDELKKIRSDLPADTAEAPLSYNYVNLFLGNILQELSHRAGLGERYRNLKKLAREPRFHRAIGYVDPRHFQKPLDSYLRLMANGQPFALLVRYFAAAVLRRCKRLFTHR